MSDEYGGYSFRKSKKEKKINKRNRVYKRGGKYRSIDLNKNE